MRRRRALATILPALLLFLPSIGRAASCFDIGLGSGQAIWNKGGGPAKSYTLTGTPTGCLGTWTVSTNASWVQISPTSGTGDVSLSLTTGPNPGPSRTEIITINFTPALGFPTQIYAGQYGADSGILPSSDTPGFVGAPYSVQYSLNDAFPPISPFSFSGDIPPGLHWDGSGTLSGTPTTVGTYTFMISVNDAVANWYESRTIRIVQPILIETGSLPAGMVGQNYRQTLTATGGTGSFSWGLASGTLPPGLHLSAQGLLSGIPTSAGTFTFGVGVTDSAQTIATETLSITVNPASVPQLSLPSITTSAIEQGLSVTLPVTAAGGVPPYSYSIVSGTLPPGLTLSGGAITGTPAAPGSFQFVLRVTDSTGQTAAQTYSLTVNPPPPNLQASPPGISFSYHLGGQIPAAQTLNVTSSGIPLSYTVAEQLTGFDWLILRPSGGTTPGTVTISVNPGTLGPGTYTAALAISSDQAAHSISLPVTLNIILQPLTSSVSSLSFTTAVGIPPPDPQTVEISAPTGTAFAISTPDAWLAAVADQPYTDAKLTISIDASKLAAGTYNGSIVVTDTSPGASPLIIPVALTVIAQPTLRVYPTSLTFRFPAAPPSYVAYTFASQSLSVFSARPGTRFSISASGAFDPQPGPLPLLALSSPGGDAPATLYVAANSLGIAAQNSGSLLITADGTIPPKIVVPVTVITDSEPPKLAVSPQFFRAAVTQGSTGVVGQVVVSNLGDGELDYTASAPDGSWLGVQLHGVVAGHDSTVSGVNTIDLVVDARSMPIGQFWDHFDVCVNGSQCETVTVFIMVSAQSPTVMQLSQTAVQLTFGVSLPSTPISILNLGCENGSPTCQTYLWTAQCGSPVFAVCTDALGVSSGSNTASGLINDPTNLTVTYEPWFIVKGAYRAPLFHSKKYARGKVTATTLIGSSLSAPAPGSPQEFTVAAELVRPGSGGLVIVPSSGDCALGGYCVLFRPGTLQVVLENLTAAPVDFTVASGTGDSQDWIAVTPSSGTIPPATATQRSLLTLSVKVSALGLAKGPHTGMVRVAGSDGSILSAVVINFIPGGSLAPPPHQAAPQWNHEPVLRRVSCRPTQLIAGIGSIQEGFNVSAGDFVNVQAAVSDDCGEPLESGTVVAFFNNGDAALPLQPLGGGTWGATWLPHGVSSDVRITLAAFSGDARNLSSAPSQLGGRVGPADDSAPPWIDTIADAGGMYPSGIVAEGATIRIRGERLAPPGASDSRGLSGVTVTIGDQDLVLQSASPTEIVAQVPSSIPSSLLQSVIVQQGDLISAPAPVTVVASYSASAP